MSCLVRLAAGQAGCGDGSRPGRLAAGPGSVDGLRGRPHVAARAQGFGPLRGELGRAHVVKRQDIGVAVEPLTGPRRVVRAVRRSQQRSDTIGRRHSL